KIGMDLLQTQESVTVNKLIAHGGIFKTKKIAQQVLASAVNNDITVMDTASEGGAWGISILAYYSALQEQISLETFLNDYVFEGATEVTVTPSSQEVVNFNNYVAKVKQALPIEQAIDKYLGGEADVRTIKS
ncbi:MAG TPA: ATPase, partial [Staphylococcus arlettae]|nr:ATPase [Staphylococcus arlettae]